MRASLKAVGSSAVWGSRCEMGTAHLTGQLLPGAARAEPPSASCMASRGTQPPVAPRAGHPPRDAGTWPPRWVAGFSLVDPELEAGTEIQDVLLLIQPWLSGSMEAGVCVSSWIIAGREAGFLQVCLAAAASWACHCGSWAGLLG